MTVKKDFGGMHSVLSYEMRVWREHQHHRRRDAAGTNILTFPDVPGLRREFS